MEDMSNNNSREKALAVARFLSDHKGEDTVLLDLGAVSTIADYFVITTARSSAHLVGLLRELFVFFSESDIKPLKRHKSPNEKGWLLVDCGDIIIHLMEKQEREFYELEKLWFKASMIPYSSKSS
jgi:ribosome-associated protein